MESIHEYVLNRLEATKRHWPAVAKGAGIPYGTLKKIATRETISPRFQNLEQLEKYFRKQEGT